MRTVTASSGGTWWHRQLQEPEVGVALVAAGCLIVEAVIAKNVLDVELDVISQFAAMWIFIAYLVSGLRSRASGIAFIAAIILATAAVLVLYAV
jgi:hypothetical protein